MKKDWNSHIRAKNPIDVTPAKPAPEVSNPGSSVFCFKMMKSLAIFRRFSHQRTLFHHPARQKAQLRKAL